MMIFWMVCALLLIAALAFVVWPLWRGSKKSNSVLRDHANLEIFRDQVAEMDADLRNGLLTQEMYEQGRLELQSRLLDEVAEKQTLSTVAAQHPLKVLAIVLALLLPLSAIGLYLKLGNYQAISPSNNSERDNRISNIPSAAALKSLEEKVSSNPDDAETLFQLARAYSELERYGDAVQAYDKLTRMVPNEAQLWADYADVLAMASGRSMVGTPTMLLEKALELDPDNFKALALSGSAAMERGDYQATVRHWEKLRKMIPPDDENAKIVDNGIQHARSLLAQKGQKMPASPSSAGQVQAGKEAITGKVALSDALKGQASPNDTLFVLVRAAQGPKMPLAIIRKQVKDLPLKFTLDDSTAMSPEMKLSNFDQVVVIARVSKTGNAMSQSGDLQGMSAPMKPGTKGVKLVIDTRAP